LNPLRAHSGSPTERHIAMFLFLMAAACLAQARSLTGRWDLTVETSQGKATPTMDLKQDGDKLTGIYRGRLGEVPLEGRSNGDSIEFSVKLKFRDQEITVKYTGRVQDDSMKGTVQFGGSTTGSWSAQRHQ